MSCHVRGPCSKHWILDRSAPGRGQEHEQVFGLHGAHRKLPGFPRRHGAPVGDRTGRWVDLEMTHEVELRTLPPRHRRVLDLPGAFTALHEAVRYLAIEVF